MNVNAAGASNNTVTFFEHPPSQLSLSRNFGNVARNRYHGPGINNTNFIVGKNFSISSDGARYVQIRMESDNVFNHTQFLNPTANFTSGISVRHISSRRSFRHSSQRKSILTAQTISVGRALRF